MSTDSFDALGPLFIIVNSPPKIAFGKAWPKMNVFFSSREAKSRENVPPAGRLRLGPPGMPRAAPPHQPWRAGIATCFGFKEAVHCDGPVYWDMTQPVHGSYQGPALQFDVEAHLFILLPPLSIV